MPSLDGLRGAAIILVVLDHGEFSHFGGAGGAGVTLFFALSGFLITGLLLKELDQLGRVDILAFYVRRARRLLPALIVFLIAVVAWFGRPALPSAVVTILYLANVPASGETTGLFFALHHMWSLAVEEQFYLVWPTAIVLVTRLVPNRRRLVQVLAGAVIVALLLRVAAYSALGYDFTYRSTPTNLLPLLAGATVAAGVRATVWRAGRTTGLAGTALLAAAAVAPVPASDVWMIVRTIVTVVAATMLLSPGAAWLRWAPLRYCGRISYGWYLWHVPLQVQFGGAEGAVLSFLAAIVSYYLWEQWWTRPASVSRSPSAGPARSSAAPSDDCRTRTA